MGADHSTRKEELTRRDSSIDSAQSETLPRLGLTIASSQDDLDLMPPQPLQGFGAGGGSELRFQIFQPDVNSWGMPPLVIKGRGGELRHPLKTHRPMGGRG